MTKPGTKHISIREKERFLTRIINYVLLVSTVVLTALTRVIPSLLRAEFNFAEIRIALILLLVLGNFYLMRKKRYKLVKILLIVLPVQILIVFPILAGYVLEASYIISPFGIVALSLIPILILDPEQHGWPLLISQVYFLFLVLISDSLMDHFSPVKLTSSVLVKEFYPFYKGAPLIMMLFLNASVYYQRKIGLQFEKHFREKQEEAGRESRRAASLNEELYHQHASLTRHKELIEQQNKLFKESVTYARHIQQAVLPAEEDIRTLLPRHFIYLMPRDVVSGDFYWVEAVGEQIVIVVGDCTGHGVPGAFMSMMGISFLQDSINDAFKRGTKGIMEELRQKVIQSLHLTGKISDPKMGMDMGLVIFNPHTRELSFTGAHQNLYVFNAGQFIKVKGDPIPVGLDLKSDRQFSSHKLELEKGDTFYMFTDGYPDQFGGPDNKKLGYPRFKELLAELQLIPMKQQQFKLASAFEKWKGAIHQLDDVLILGVRC